MDSIKKWRPPAITTGLIPFVAGLRALGATDSLKLTPNALFKLELNRLSFYPLVARSWLELGILWSLFTPCCGQFELQNGTVRTGIVLNITAVLPAVITNLLYKLAGSAVFDGEYYGPEGWILALMAFLSVTSWKLPVIPVKTIVITIPAFVFPVLAYALTVLLFPKFYLINLLALAMGFGLGLGPLGFLVNGTSKVVEWIETKIAKVIALLRYIVTFVTEVEARELRKLKTTTRQANQPGDIPLEPASLTTPEP